MFAKGFTSNEPFYDDPNYEENMKQNSVSNNIAKAMPIPANIPGVKPSVPNTQSLSMMSKPAVPSVSTPPIKKIKGGTWFEPAHYYIF